MNLITDARLRWHHMSVSKIPADDLTVRSQVGCSGRQVVYVWRSKACFVCKCDQLILNRLFAFANAAWPITLMTAFPQIAIRWQ